MLKVYFTASTSYNGENIPYYKKIIDLLIQEKITVVSGKQIISQKLLEKDIKLEKKEIFMREKNLIDQADFIVAEVTKPSLGVGGEIVYSLINKKPVLALIQANHDDKISPMITGNPSDNLFLETYTEGKLPYIIRDFIKYVRTLKKRRGKLIVIDGGDGSGKTTQANLLVDYLKTKKIPVKYMDFPQYYHSFHGKTVAKFLRGEFGKIDEVSPYLASLAYAVDRVSVKKEMDDFLEAGGYIISNRYATSSMAHQSAKFKDEKEKKEFLKWIYELEYKVHKMPKENLVIYLYVPWEIGLILTGKKTFNEKFLEGKKDITNDQDHRIKTENTYLNFVKKYKHWIKIDCVKNKQLLSKENIHHQIITVLSASDTLFRGQP